MQFYFEHEAIGKSPERLEASARVDFSSRFLVEIQHKSWDSPPAVGSYEEENCLVHPA